MLSRPTTHDDIEDKPQDRTPRPGPDSQQIVDDMLPLIALLAWEQRRELAEMIREGR